MEESFDPRVKRMELQDKDPYQMEDMNHWQTYEVFHQKKRGENHVHVGTVHASDNDMALILAKEQYARRQECVNIWVVKSADISALPIMDSDMFSTIPEKTHREPGPYIVRDKIEAFKAKQK